MSTIEKILEALNKTSEDKKSQLTSSYQEKSVWLRNEFDIIRQLIKQNPRDNLSNSDSPIDAPSDAKRLVEDESSSKKRKSPETAGIKVSPQQKRSSVGIDELIMKAGLPADLNRLKKEQLLSELEKRKCFELTMKARKNEMIDALKDVLVDEHRQAANQKDLQCSNSDESKRHVDGGNAFPHVAESTSAEVKSETAVPPSGADPSSSGKRKGSLMAEFRSIVNNNNNQQLQTAGDRIRGSVTNASGRLSSVNVENEWKNRHRDSQARKSQVARPSVTFSDTSVTTSSNGSMNDTTGSLQLNTVDTVEPASAVSTAVENKRSETDEPLKQSDSASALSPAPAGNSDDDWGVSEVSEDITLKSPQLSNPKKLNVDQNKATAEPSNRVVPPSAVSPKKSVSQDGTWMEVSSPLSADSEKPDTVTEATQFSSKNSITEKKAVQPTSGKPANVVTGGGAKMTSFIDKPINSSAPVTKTVVPALQKAKQAKAAEEARLLQKKKEQAQRAQLAEEQRALQKKKEVATKAAMDKLANSSGNSTGGTSNSGSTTISSKGSTTIQAEEVAVAPTVKKGGGIFGLFGGGKKTSTTTTATAAAPSNKNLASKSAMATSSHSNTSTSTAVPSAAATVSSNSDNAAFNASSTASTSSAISATSNTNTGNGSVKLKDGFVGKSMISNIVNNYNNALKNGNPISPIAVPTSSVSSVPVESITSSSSTISAVPKPRATSPIKPAPTQIVASSSGVLKDITAKATAAEKATYPTVPSGVNNFTSSATSNATHLTQPTTAAVTQPVDAVQEEVKEYPIEDGDSSGDESGTDDESESKAERKRQMVPSWARGTELKAQLEKQYGLTGLPPVDPDTIFPEVVTCSLEEIFGCKQGINRKYSNRTSSAHWDADQLTLVEKRSYRKHMGYDKPPPQSQLNA